LELHARKKEGPKSPSHKTF